MAETQMSSALNNLPRDLNGADMTHLAGGLLRLFLAALPEAAMSITGEQIDGAYREFPQLMWSIDRQADQVLVALKR